MYSETRRKLALIRKGEDQCPWLPVFNEPPRREGESDAKFYRRAGDAVDAWIETMRAFVTRVNAPAFEGVAS